MKISKITNKVNTETLEFEELNQLLTYISTPRPDSFDMWGPAIYKNSYKNDNNYLGTPNLIVMDVDDGLSIEDCKNRLDSKNLKYGILPSRNHQRSKNGVVCDRYRVLLILSYPITSSDIFDATWEYVYETILPEADNKCKDEGRGYFYSSSVYAVCSIGEEITPQPAKEKRTETSLSTGLKDGIERDLSKSTWKFLVNGAAKGSRDFEVFKAISDFKTNGRAEEQCLAMILKAPIEYDSSFTEQTVRDKVASVYRRTGVKFPLQSSSNEKLKNFILSSWYVQDIERIRSPVVVNPNTGIRQAVAGPALRTILTADVAKDYLKTKTITVKYAYEPFKKELLFEDPDTGADVLNEYQPPFWERDYFFGGSMPMPKSEPPEIIKSFLMQIVDNDTASYNYILDWISTAIKSRNLTILTAIASEGIGKGTLGQLLGDIFGDKNWVKVRSDVFKDKFNSQFENKRFVFVDELGLSSTAEYNRFKDVVNDWIELEKKGKDAIFIRNHANFFIASNDNKAITPSPNDRRFSIINLSNQKLKDSPLRDRLYELRDKKVIEEFVGFLLHREVLHDMMTPFKSPKKTEEINEAGLAEWERHLIQEFAEQNAGSEMPLKNVGLQIKLECSMRSPPGRRKLEKLAERYPDILRLHKRGNERMIEFVKREGLQ